MSRIITLQEAVELLGEDVRICLEPANLLRRKMEDGREAELWVFNPSTGVSGRGDGRFFQVEYVDRGTWGQLAIREEPTAPQDQPIGQVVVEMNRKGQLHVHRGMGLNGEVLELHPSSLSRGALAGDAESTDVFQTNPQRIIGSVEAVLVTAEFPEDEAIYIDDFVKESTDGRSLSALVRLGLVVDPINGHG